MHKMEVYEELHVQAAFLLGKQPRCPQGRPPDAHWVGRQMPTG